MSIPDYQTLLLPLLRLIGDRKEHSLAEAVETLADQYHLTDEERRELLPSGRQRLFVNRVGWARTYLKYAGLLEPSRRAFMRLTDRGAEVLAKDLAKIDVKFLDQFPDFRAWRTARPNGAPGNVSGESVATPEEALEESYQRLRESVEAELLVRLKAGTSGFFERVVVKLLVRMGYGGSERDAGRVVGGPSDAGIDGIIKEDRLGLDVVYVQAKKWEGTTKVGRPEIQKFAGALQGQKAKKGVFITTSEFSDEAIEFAARIDTRIVLVGGSELARLLCDHDVGVTEVATYKLKKLDSDFFAEE